VQDALSEDKETLVVMAIDQGTMNMLANEHVMQAGSGQ
jgi:hypothetical protein